MLPGLASRLCNSVLKVRQALLEMRTKHEALHQTEIAAQYQQMLVTALVAAGMQLYSTHAAVVGHMQQS